jgi:hypothetical protein
MNIQLSYVYILISKCFNNTLNCSDYTRLNDRMTSEYTLQKGMGGGGCNQIFKVLFNIWLEGLRTPTQNVNHNSRFVVWDLNPGPPTYEPAMLTTRLYLVVHMLIMLKYKVYYMHKYNAWCMKKHGFPSHLSVLRYSNSYSHFLHQCCI